MNTSRRQFFIGGAAFASPGAFGGNRFMLAAILYSGDTERQDEQERICGSEPSDDLFRPVVET